MNTMSRKNRPELNRQTQKAFRENNPDKSATIRLYGEGSQGIKARFDALKDKQGLTASELLKVLLNI